jgi:hypothetical protein
VCDHTGDACTRVQVTTHTTLTWKVGITVDFSLALTTAEAMPDESLDCCEY